jgi:ferredoxin
MYILKKEGMGKWISFLREKFTVFAPVFDGVMVMRVLMDEKPVLENRMRLPPKCIIFPQTEKIFGFSERLKVDLPKDKILLLGVRPCDARSLKIFDEMFMDDPYYLARRENLLIIALSCNSPGVNCFCTSVGGSPFSSENADLLLTDLGDCYYVDVLSGRRRELIGDFDRAEEEHERRKEELKKRAEKNMKRKVNTDIRKILQKLWNSPLWEEVARRCISCGICTYLCPACYCFDLQDEDYRRVRVWDSCIFEEYTLQASGHNPRPTRMHRYRNRVYHKFDYLPENIKVVGCVGCGRCIDLCPANIDIVEVIERVGQG